MKRRASGRGILHSTSALTKLAGLLVKTNQPIEAEQLYRRTLEIDEESLGLVHSKVATDLSNVARVLFESNRFAEAEPLYRRALEIWDKSLELENPNLASVLANLVQVAPLL